MGEKKKSVLLIVCFLHFFLPTLSNRNCLFHSRRQRITSGLQQICSPPAPHPTPGLTLVAEGQPLLLARLDVGHPQVAVVDKGEEGRVGRTDLRVHPWPRALGLDFQGLHGGHLQTERPGSMGQEAPAIPPPSPPASVAHHEAILAAIPAVEEAVAGLEKEEATLAVEVVGGDAEDAQAFPLPQQFLLPRVDPVVRRGLRTQGGHQCQRPRPWPRFPTNSLPNR